MLAPCHQLDLGAELHRVRRHREIDLGADGGIADRRCMMREPAQRRRAPSAAAAVGGMEAADREQEIGVVAPVDAHRHVAGQREVEHVRIVERGVELELPCSKSMMPTKLTCRLRIGDVLGRQRDAEHAERWRRRGAGSRG